MLFNDSSHEKLGQKTFNKSLFNIPPPPLSSNIKWPVRNPTAEDHPENQSGDLTPYDERNKHKQKQVPGQLFKSNHDNKKI